MLPELTDIASHCGLSDGHLQRLFQQWAGISPKQFLHCLTRQQLKQRLLNGENILASTLACGLSSGGRLHDLIVKFEAISPRDIKSGGAGLYFNCGLEPSPFGDCFIVTTTKGVHQLEFINAEQLPINMSALQKQWPSATIEFQHHTGKAIVEQIFSRNHAQQPLSLWLKGSPFQLKVWEALLKIPHGSLSSYAAIAAAIDQPKAARAVGNAIAKNPIAFLIPCHRVIQAIGDLGHYRWGDDRKQAIIGWETGHQD
jgi:AraC family transcriptional regulator of adaptative response/methylated-DNA-[protein]-cysteine methyltransferase